MVGVDAVFTSGVRHSLAFVTAAQLHCLPVRMLPLGSCRCASCHHPRSPRPFCVSAVPCCPLPLHPLLRTQMVAGLRLNNSSAWAAFDKMEEKVMAMEAEAEATGLLAAPDNLEAQFVRLEGSGTVEDELAALKRGQLAARSSASVPARELGRPISEVLVGTREAVRELSGIDGELEQLRKRARGQ